LTTSAVGPDRQFAAAQQNARNGGQSRRPVEAAGTAAPDPRLPLQSAQSYQASQSLIVPPQQHRPGMMVSASGYLRSIGFMCNTRKACDSLPWRNDMDLHTPSKWTFWLSVVLVVFAIVSAFVEIPYLSKYEWVRG
jgi:hypothetical protein